MSNPYVSVVIPTKNSSKVLDNCLKSIVNQEYSNFEIIVVDGHSKDNTVEIAQKYTNLVFYENYGTRAAGCNVGIQQAHGEIIAFTDDDCEVPKNWLKQIAYRFEDETLDILGGSTITPKASSRMEKAFGIIQNYYSPLTHARGAYEKVPGCNSAYRKTALIQVGGFNDNLPYVEEQELQFRLKQADKKIEYLDNLFVLHNRRANAKQFWKQHFNYGVGKGRWIRLNFSAIKISNILVQLLIFGPFILFPILALVNSFIMYGTLLGAAIVVLAISVYASIKEQQVCLFPFTVLASLLWVYSEGLGQLKGFFTRDSISSKQLRPNDNILRSQNL